MEQTIHIQEILSKQKELRMYSVENAEHIANKIAAIHYENFSDNEMMAQIRSSLIFRDNKEKYWHIDLASRKWKEYDDGWREKVPPDGYLEGLADLKAWLPMKQEIDDAAFEDAEKRIDPDDPKQAPSTTHAKDTLAEIIRDTWQDYIKGSLTSLSTDMLLREYMIVDKNADFWTVGCRSGYWYHFNGKYWEKSDTPPADEMIVRSEDLDQHIEEIKHTVLMIFKSGRSFLPEQVTTLWDPPTSFPNEVVHAEENEKYVNEAIPSAHSKESPIKTEKNISTEPSTNSTYTCPQCAAPVNKGQKFCTQCGAKLPEDLAPVQEKPIVKRCPVCGAVLKPGAKFCTQCGAKISE